MATINLGSIKFKWQGAYAGGTSYTLDDVVSYNGSSYICILASTGNLPTNATYWEQMSSAGTNGTDGTDLTTTLTTQGDIVYRDASGLARLGAGTAGQVLQSGGTGANVSWVDASAGITEADQWRLSADSSGNGTISSNLERNDSTAFNYIGTGMSQSSGVFSFPSTGIYHVQARFIAESDGSGGNDNNVTGVMYVTTDNSTYTKVAECRCRVDATQNTMICSTFLDVTNTSNVKVYFAKENFNTGTLFLGNTTHNRSEFTFIRLGDT